MLPVAHASPVPPQSQRRIPTQKLGILPLGTEKTEKVHYCLLSSKLLLGGLGFSIIQISIKFIIIQTREMQCISFISFIVQLVKNPPEVQKTPVRFLGLEDPLEKG